MRKSTEQQTITTLAELDSLLQTLGVKRKLKLGDGTLDNFPVTIMDLGKAPTGYEDYRIRLDCNHDSVDLFSALNLCREAAN